MVSPATIGATLQHCPIMKSDLRTRTLESLANAYLAHELRVNPEFQRGLKWSLSQKQGLIDSLLRGYQIPIFYIHLEARTNNYTGGVESTAERNEVREPVHSSAGRYAADGPGEAGCLAGRFYQLRHSPCWQTGTPSVQPKTLFQPVSGFPCPPSYGG